MFKEDKKIELNKVKNEELFTYHHPNFRQYLVQATQDCDLHLMPLPNLLFEVKKIRKL